MKSTWRRDGTTRAPEAPVSRAGETERKARYHKPKVQPAGSVFSRTKALGSGTKDGLTGSALL